MNSKPNQGTDPKSKPKTTSQTSSLEVEFDGDSSGASSLGQLDTDDDDFDPDVADLINIRIKEDESELSSNVGELPEVSDEEKNLPFPSTNLVLRLNPILKHAAASYLVRKIKTTKGSGGAELLIRCEPFAGPGEIVLHIAATNERFIEVAEFLELKKVDDTGLLREFHVRDLNAFIYDDIILDTLITPAEKELAVLYELQNCRALPGESHVPSYPSIKLHSGQSIFQVYVQHNLITDLHPLHDEAGLDLLLKTSWYAAFFASEPFEQLRKYFGEAITLNFTFTGCYTYFLLYPALLALFLMLIPESIISERTEISIVCLVNLVFISFFLKVWRRKCSELAYTWGTLRMTVWELPRQNYRGKMGLDPVTGQYQPRYPGYKTAIKVWLVSVPLVMCCMYGAYQVMLCYFMAEEMLRPHQKRHEGTLLGICLKLTCSTVYAISVAIMTYYYRLLANRLTEWENHRTQTQFDRNHVAKLIAFESVNNFMSFVYIAFVLKNMELLRRQVIVMICVMHLILALQEIVIPLILRSTTKKLGKFLHRHDASSLLPDVVQGAVDKVKLAMHRKSPTTPATKTNNTKWPSPGPTIRAHPNHNPKSMGLEVLPENDPRIEMSKFEGEMDPYRGCYDDYSELFVQFGYIFLFSPLFPQAAAVAVVMNIFLMYANIYKLCAVFQRPIPKRVKDIGSWQVAFELIGYFAVMSNIALLVLSTGLKEAAIERGWTEEHFFFGLILAEHLIIAGRIAVNKLVPNVPQWVRVATARTEYRARMAFKKEQSTKSRKRISTKFQTINPILQKKQKIFGDGSPGTSKKKA